MYHQWFFDFCGKFNVRTKDLCLLRSRCSVFHSEMIKTALTYADDLRIGGKFFIGVIIKLFALQRFASLRMRTKFLRVME